MWVGWWSGQSIARRGDVIMQLLLVHRLMPRHRNDDVFVLRLNVPLRFRRHDGGGLQVVQVIPFVQQNVLREVRMGGLEAIEIPFQPLAENAGKY